LLKLNINVYGTSGKLVDIVTDFLSCFKCLIAFLKPYGAENCSFKVAREQQTTILNPPVECTQNSGGQKKQL
jgi:hypothetical protein